MIWKAIPDYPDYEVSDEGEVRRAKSRRVPKLKAHLNYYGYPHVTLHLRGRRSKRAVVHRLVARAFLGPCPAGKEVNHRSGIKTENAVANLEYVTRGDNNRHALLTGLRVPLRGEQHGCSKLRDNQIPEIFLLSQQHWTTRAIGHHFGVSASQVSRILRRVNRATSICSAT